MPTTVPAVSPAPPILLAPLPRRHYDATNRVTRITQTHHGAPIATYTYAYDANGNRTTERVTQGGPKKSPPIPMTPTDRLLAVAYPDMTTTYTYDDAGNRLTENTIRAVDGRSWPTRYTLITLAIR